MTNDQPFARNRIMERARRQARNNPIDMPVLTRRDLTLAIMVALGIMSLAVGSLSLFGEFVRAVQ